MAKVKNKAPTRGRPKIPTSEKKDSNNGLTPEQMQRARDEAAVRNVSLFQLNRLVYDWFFKEMDIIENKKKGIVTEDSIIKTYE